MTLKESLDCLTLEELHEIAAEVGPKVPQNVCYTRFWSIILSADPLLCLHSLETKGRGKESRQ